MNDRMRRLFKNHWINHDELLVLMGTNPQPYCRLAYWVGRLTASDAPVFFITGGEAPQLQGDLRFWTWRLDGHWHRLAHPAEAEGVLTEYLDRSRPAEVEVPVDVHWHIQFQD
jgi:hypothetical protein